MKNSGTIKVKDLCKHFNMSLSDKGLTGSLKALFVRKKKTIRAVDGISFEVKQGEFVGYVGENGAGKSTTIKILTGILYPTSGTCMVKGLIPYKNRILNASSIGVVFGQRTQLWWDLPVRESFDMLRHIYKVPIDSYLTTLKGIKKSLDLDPLMDMPVRKLSLGQRMRCDIAASLLHNPSVLFLDEPTIGLDLIAKEGIRTFLVELNQKMGVTIVLTTHDMSDIEHLCKRLIILDKGKIIFDGKREALQNKFMHNKFIEVEFQDSINELKEFPGLKLIERHGLKIKFTYKKDRVENIATVIGKLVNRYQIKDISVRDPSLETVIKSIYENKSLLKEEPAV